MNSPSQFIDTSNLNWVDMALLKKQDPFMYYSIPGNRDTELPREDVDLSDLELPHRAGDMSMSFTIGSAKKITPKTTAPASSRRRHSIAAKAALDQGTSFDVQEKKVPVLVERRSAISFETKDLIMDNDIMMEEIARLQPNASRRRMSSFRSSRRGSLLQEVLFSMMDPLGQFDSDADSSAGL